MLLSLQVPTNNERGPRYAEQELAAIYQANAASLRIALLLAHHAGQAGLYVRYPQDLKTVVERQLATQYPNPKQERLPDDSIGQQAPLTTWTAESVLSPDVFPLRRYSPFVDVMDDGRILIVNLGKVQIGDVASN
ncbi:MAG: hypothetical protein ABI614_02680, partial [Planctomycetota bacterium]